ncbi:MAG: hypothetical protein QGH94_01280 [Phycisphaerae bacterium]|jgi:hypothetical protein|nr:hypothetical protein [Phycisphaerae bacterium]MDP7286602.1 hypothetical protein [Phycisphaerae bacterium]
MRAVFISIVTLFIGAVGCGDRRDSGDSTGGTPTGGDADGILADINLSHPSPKELGTDWVYSIGRRGPNSFGHCVNENYKNEKTGKSVSLTIQKLRTPSEAAELFEIKVAKFKSKPYSGLGQEARIEPRGSKRRPYVWICFRRANVIVFLDQIGKDYAAAMEVAKLIDKKIKVNLK